MSPEALEELLYSQEWKDLEVIHIEVESEKELSIAWRDLTDIDDKGRINLSHKEFEPKPVKKETPKKEVSEETTEEKKD